MENPRADIDFGFSIGSVAALIQAPVSADQKEQIFKQQRDHFQRLADDRGFRFLLSLKDILDNPSGFLEEAVGYLGRDKSSRFRYQLGVALAVTSIDLERTASLLQEAGNSLGIEPNVVNDLLDDLRKLPLESRGQAIDSCITADIRLRLRLGPNHPPGGFAYPQNVI